MIKNSVVLVPFPFDDFTEAKVRPALCLTSEIGKFNHVIIAFISSKIPDDIVPSDLVVKKEGDHFENTGLLVDSVIRLHKLVTIPKHLIKRRLGEIDKTLASEVNKKITSLFLGI